MVTLTEDYEGTSFNVADYADVSQLSSINAAAHVLTIVGGNYKSRIQGTEDDDYIKGGVGADVFIYNKGNANDSIEDYKQADGDYISLGSGASISKATLSGSNFVFTILVKDADGNEIWYNGTPIEKLIVDDTGKKATITAAYTDSALNIADYGTAINSVDASAVEHGLTIIGGKGADSLWGDAGKDIFVYSDGDDVINDFESNIDRIMIFSGTLKAINEDSAGNLTIKVGVGKHLDIHTPS